MNLLPAYMNHVVRVNRLNKKICEINIEGGIAMGFWGVVGAIIVAVLILMFV